VIRPEEIKDSPLADEGIDLDVTAGEIFRFLRESQLVCRKEEKAFER
jgi:hypothetical protein